MMEHILPRDMINEVFKFLTNHELAMYGQTSKTSLQSTEIEWKRRYDSLDLKIINLSNQTSDIMEESNESEMKWMNHYTKIYKQFFTYKLKTGLDVFRITKGRTNRQKVICELFDFLLEHRVIFLEFQHFKNLET